MEQIKGPVVPLTREPIQQAFTPAAKLNAYYVCHNASEMLTIRGFPSKEYPEIETPEHSEESDNE